MMTTRGPFPTGFPDLLPPDEWHRVAQDFRLTPQEVMTLRLLCRGLANTQMAARLEIATPTVRSHLRSIYQKFNRRSRQGVLLTLVHGYRRCPVHPGSVDEPSASASAGSA